MNHRLLMSVAAAALIAGTGLTHAQAPASGAGASRSATPAASPSVDRAAPAEHTAPVNRDEATDTSKAPEAGAGIKSSASDDKVQRDNGDVRSSDAKGDKAPANTQANDSKANPNPKAADSNPNAKAAADGKSSTTTGQAAAGAKLSTEQRTKISTTIKQQNIKPVTNVNFNVSVGTRVPRDVGFHPLPAEIITVYPDWRGYEFFLVNNDIIVVNPRTLEIVAVLDA
ncbi:MAG: hypothetical protein JWQ94_3461 [Tardiphaga sp.]|nr:hypothetical protein [Tardiphaga sp.]